MVLGVVLPHRRELTGIDQEHRAALQVLRNSEVVAHRERVHFGPRAVDDDANGLRGRRQVIREVGAEARVVRGGRGRRGRESQ